MWLLDGLCWFWMGIVVGFFFGVAVSKIGEPETQEVLARMQRNGYRIVRQGAVPAIGDDPQ